MKIIKEDYVSFETAKLLKDKGFDEPYHATYDTAVVGGKPEFSEYEVLNYFPYGMKNTDDKYSMVISDPSQAMVMKWLRVNFGYSIIILADGDLGDLYYLYEIQEIDNKLLQVNGSLDIEDQRFNSYEEACEAAIKYCLENLI